MTLNSSGAISLGGTTSGESIAVENGGPGTAEISLNDAAVRSLAGVPSGAIIMPTNFYGKSNTVTINLTISADTQNYDVYTNRGPTYSAGNSIINLTVNPGVTVGSTSTGTYAMLVPSAFSPTDQITIVNNGVIMGAGGPGGPGGAGPGGGNGSPGTPGSGGGSALYVNRPTTVTNNGTLAAGGGGGGGGAGYSGGGAGSGGAGAGGANAPGNPGSSGGPVSGGGGGSSGNPPRNGSGGAGGGRGAAGTGGNGPAPPQNTVTPGGGGGATGNYIVGNPFVTYPATGTRQGNVA